MYASQNSLAAMPTDKTRLEMILGGVESIDGQLQTAVTRLRSIADRLVGSVPEPVCESNGSKMGAANLTPGPLCNRLEHHSQSAASHIDVLFRQIDRLDRI